MIQLDAFLSYVALHCMGVPEPTLLIEVRSACIEFCERSRVWKERVSLSVREGRAEYEIPLPEGAQLVKLEEVFYDGDRIEAMAPDALHDRWQRWMSQTGVPSVYTQLDPMTLTLVPKPTVSLSRGLVLRACFKPDRSADTVPDWLFQHYVQPIAAGALARLMAVNSLPCFNPQLAMVQGVAFAEGINKALMAADKGFTRAPRRTVPRFL